MKQLTLFLILPILLTGCLTTATPDLTLKYTEAPNLEEQWKNYNAVYEYDQLSIHQTFNYSRQSYDMTAVADQRIRILNQEGLKYGTTKVSKVGEQVTSFSVKLFDHNDKEVSIDLDKIKKQYNKNEMIVVPNVTVGSKIVIRIGFQSTRPMVYSEYYFQRSIPVIYGRLIFRNNPDYSYRFKEYGGAPKPVNYKASDIIQIWEQSNILPVDDHEDYWTIDNLSRVAIFMKGYYGEYFYQSNSWKELAQDYKEYFIPKALLQTKGSLKKIVKSITKDTPSPQEKAEKILDYVQNNISYHRSNNELINLSQVLAKKQADEYEMAVLLREMYKIAKIPAKILVTRSKRQGGFDPNFATFNALADLMVMVEIEGKQKIAYPYNKNRKLGEYPFTYFGLQALDIEQEKVCDLPKPKYSQRLKKSEVIFDLSSPGKPHNWTFTYGKYSSSSKKSNLDDKTPKERNTAIQKMLEKIYDTENKMQSVDITGLDKKGAPLSLNMIVENPSIMISKNKETFYSLAPFFRTFFEDYDLSRTIDYEYGIDYTYIDHITVKHVDTANETVDFTCKELNNPLFSVSCTKETHNGQTDLKRAVKIKKTRLSAQQMQQIFPDIQKLNTIKDSYIVSKKGQA